MTKKPISLLQGDIHLHPWIWSRERAISGDAVFGLQELARVAVEQGVKHVHFLGDLFDVASPHPQMVRAFSEVAQNLHDHGILLTGSQGNHDLRTVPWYSAASPVVQHIGDGVPVTIEGIRFAALDYAPTNVIAENLAKLGARIAGGDHVDVLLLHQLVRQEIDIDGQWNCDLDWVPQSIRHVVLGDVHMTRDYRLPNGGYAYYTGGTHPRSRSEIAYDKNAFVLSDDLSVTRVPVRVRPIQAFQHTVNDDLLVADFVQWQKQVLTTAPWHEVTLPKSTIDDLPQRAVLFPVALVRYWSDSPEVPNRINAVAHPDVKVVYERLIRRTDQTTQDAATGLSEIPSQPELLAQLLNQAEHPEAFGLLSDLLSAPRGELAERVEMARERFLRPEVAHG